jgi:ABC transport system ATP-binding/permease protein
LTININISNQQKAFSVKENEVLAIGRNPSGNEVLINDIAISRYHAKIEIKNQQIYISDLGSSNGTFINAERIAPHQPKLINISDQIYFANPNHWLKISNDTSAPSIKSKHTEQNSKLEKSLAELLQNKSSITIGRSANNDLVLNDNIVSRQHAKVYFTNGKYWVEDLKSTNGTFVNGKKTHQATQLQEQDELIIGLHRFLLFAAAQDLQKGAAIAAYQINKIYDNGNIGLQSTTLEIPYQKMVALMGPSGCGKSTLLKALNGDSPPSKGTVKIFGLDLYENFEVIKQTISYVPQENIVHNDLTVADSLYFAAKLKLPQHVSEEEINERITYVLDAVQINRSDIKNTLVGQLSGGQKKRVSIAVELLTKPKILFLDEPTSPLDPETIEEFLKCLKNLCKQGTTVIMVTHKPDDLHFADSIIFMGIQGHLVFHQEKENIFKYFQKENIIEIYAMLSQIETTKDWYAKWGEKIKNIAIQPDKENKNQALSVNNLHQFYWLFRRYWTLKTGNSKYLALLAFQPLLIAFLIIMVFDSFTYITPNQQQVGNIGIIFLMSISAIWFGVSNAAKEIIGEKDIFKRERMFNLKLVPYIFSKSLVLFVLSAFQIAFFLLILFFFYSELSGFFSSFLLMSLISFAAIQFGLLLSSFSKTTEQVMTILPIALMPQIILAGVVQPIQNKITMLLSYLTIGRWGTESFARLQDISNKNNNYFSTIIQKQYYQLNNVLDFSDSFSTNVWMIILLIGFKTILIYLTLINYHKK